MSMLSDYQRMVEKPYIEALERRIAGLRARAESAEREAEKLREALRAAHDHIADNDESGAYLILRQALGEHR